MQIDFCKVAICRRSERNKFLDPYVKCFFFAPRTRHISNYLSPFDLLPAPIYSPDFSLQNKGLEVSTQFFDPKLTHFLSFGVEFGVEITDDTTMVSQYQKTHFFLSSKSLFLSTRDFCTSMACPDYEGEKMGSVRSRTTERIVTFFFETGSENTSK